MRWTGLETARRFVLWAAIGCAMHTALIQPAAATSPQEQTDQAAQAAGDEPASETDLDAEVQRMHRGFDLLARSFTKKKRSELINLKTYSDAEWAQAERAVKTNNAACRKGDAEACLAAGRAYEAGDGVWIVPDIAYVLYNDACNLGLGEGCRAFIDLASTGHGYPDDSYDETDGLIEKGCDLGDAESCLRFAEALLDGSAEDVARADALLDASCTAGGMEACAALGRFLLESGTPEETERGTQILDAACRQTGAEACRTLTRHLESGPNPDPAQINIYTHYACYAGSADDCAEMGRRAWRGIGLAADRDLAMRYFAQSCSIEPLNCDLPRQLSALPRLRAACDADDARACADLGKALRAYSSPEYDRERAIALLETSCRKGVRDVCADAAAIISQRDPDAPARIAQLLETGCAADDPESCFKLARSLEYDPGTPELERAVALFGRLCDAQYPDACESEQRYAGVVASARILSAGETFTAPLPTDDPGAVLQAGEVMGVCFTGSERFRGKTYVKFNCDRGEKGIGSDRARPGQAPWQALLWRPATMFGNSLGPAQRVLCGGSLIAMGWVLTAAHCLTDEGIDLADKQARADYRIRLGVYDPGADEGVSYPILRVIRHPQFDPGNKFAFDVALIEYSPLAARAGGERDPDRANPIRAIALDPAKIGERKIAAGMPAYAFGWGWTAEQNSAATDYLQILKLDLSSEASCTALTGFTKALSNAALCAKGKNNEQTCYGDSGGPLVYYDPKNVRPVLIGIVSAGLKCGTTATKRASQYTRVAKVKDWIASYVPAIR